MVESYIKLGWLYFLKFRKKRRNLTFILIVAFFLFTFFYSLFGTLFSNLESWGNMLLGSGTIVLEQVQDYDIITPLKAKTYFSYNRFQEKLFHSDIIITPRLRVSALLEGYESENDSVSNLIGVDVEKELKLTPDIYVSKGRYPERGKKEICFFSDMAGSLNVDIGDEVIVYTNTVDGYINYDLAKVVGLLDNSRVQYFYGSSFGLSYASIDFVQQLKGVKNNQVSEIGFRVKSFFERLKISYKLPEGFRIVNFWESIEILYSLYWVYSFFMWLLLIMILVVVYSSVYHNINLMIRERLTELGVYITFGATKGRIVVIWLFELVIHLVYCSIFGGFLTFILIAMVNKLGIYATNEVFSVLFAASELKIPLNIGYYFTSFCILWMIICLAAMKPILFGVREKMISNLFRK